MNDYEKEVFELIKDIQISLARVEEKLDVSTNDNMALELRVSKVENILKEQEVLINTQSQQIKVLEQNVDRNNSRTWAIIVFVLTTIIGALFNKNFF